MINPSILSSSVLHCGAQTLRNDGAYFTGGGTETVSSGTISGREYFAGDDKCGRVGAEILEEVGETDQGEESAS